MHPRIAELLNHIDEQRVKLRAAVDSVPVEDHGRSPAEGQWSVAGVIEHLAVVESRITELFRARVGEARANGIGDETETSLLLATLETDVIEDRTRRLRASTPIQPSGNLDSATAWKALEASRAEFRSAVVDADGLALSQISHPHLYFGPFNLYRWIAFIGSHEARHAAQIREIGEALAKGQV